MFVRGSCEGFQAPGSWVLVVRFRGTCRVSCRFAADREAEM
jgi:hypothetical protein